MEQLSLRIIWWHIVLSPTFSLNERAGRWLALYLRKLYIQCWAASWNLFDTDCWQNHPISRSCSFHKWISETHICRHKSHVVTCTMYILWVKDFLPGPLTLFNIRGIHQYGLSKTKENKVKMFLQLLFQSCTLQKTQHLLMDTKDKPNQYSTPYLLCSLHVWKTSHQLFKTYVPRNYQTFFYTTEFLVLFQL